MKYLLSILLLCLAACSFESSSNSSTSETQNTVVHADSITFIDDGNVSENIYWNINASDSLNIQLVPPQINKEIRYEDLNEPSEWLMKLTTPDDTVSRSMSLYEIIEFTVDTVVVGVDTYMELNLEFKWINTIIEMDKQILISEPLSEPSPLPTPNMKLRGLTWKIGVKQIDSKAWYASCDGSRDGSLDAAVCDTLKGPSLCTDSYRVLCQTTEDLLRPSYSINAKGINDHDPLYSQGWGQGKYDFTGEVKGDDLTSRAVADQICVDKFGAGSKMASYHNSLWHSEMTLTNKVETDFITPMNELKEGGWGFWMYLPDDIETSLPTNVYTTRFWVAMESQPINCWDE